MNPLIIHHPGAHTTVQDLGRPGYRNLGVSPGGAVDKLASRVANWLVGNFENTPLLECALSGPKIEFKKSSLVAITGGNVDGVESWPTIAIKAGAIVNLSRIKTGNYIYLAIAGGIDLPSVLESASTDLRVGWGGLDGRLLRAGDELAIKKSAAYRIHLNHQVNYRGWYDDSPIRIVSGCDSDKISPKWINQPFTVSAKSDRMGIRLDCRSPIKGKLKQGESIPAFPGTIQCPPDGLPIVLSADAQTLGGYPQIGHVIAADLHRLAQIRPGQSFPFEMISIAAAHAIARQREKELARLRFALQSNSK